MAQSIVSTQTNDSVEIIMLTAPIADPNYLLYAKGGGDILSNINQDLVQGGNLYYGGNPPIDLTYAIKSCENVSIITESVQTESGLVDRGLLYYNSVANKYFWDEVYTTPLGYYTAITGTPTGSNFSFTISTMPTAGNQMLIAIKDINVFPKVGDYIIVQKIPNTSLGNNDSYTDDIDSLPVNLNSELYQFKITQVFIESGSGNAVVFRLYLDKSITLINNGAYSLVLLNRENTGIQKELFYDTFEQIEIHKIQLLGDPYDNTNNFALPSGRKNYLNYQGSSYLGLKVLLNNIINIDDSPFIVYDLNDNIKDRFKPVVNTLEFLLPFVMIQNDNRTTLALTNPNKLINSGSVQNEENGVGRYSGLYFNWDTEQSKRIGFVFYELRIVVIDDSEMVYALGYDSNRNYTLPAASLISGYNNDNVTPGGGVELNVSNLLTINTNQVLVQTSTPHGLLTGTQIFISNVFVTDTNNNVVPSSANGNRYVKLLTPNDPYIFQIYADSAFATPIIANGTYTVSNDTLGTVKGVTPKYQNFYTYRLIGKHYTSILPYSKIVDFNFVKNGQVDNNSTDAKVNITIPNFKWLIDPNNQVGFEATDLEIIVGTYDNDDLTNPQKITGFSNVVVIPITQLVRTRNLFDGIGGTQGDFSIPANSIEITKADYNMFIGKIGGVGAYNKATNPNGDPSYNIVTNYNHYVYTNGDPTPSDLVVGEGKWTLGNISYRTQVDRYRSTIQINIPADKWNDTTNPTYDPTNSFITDRYISEVGIVVQDTITKTEKPMIYAKIAPAIKKTTDLDLSINLSIDF